MKSLVIILALFATSAFAVSFQYNFTKSGNIYLSPQAFTNGTNTTNLCQYVNTVELIPIVEQNLTTGLQVSGSFPSNMTTCQKRNLTFVTPEKTLAFDLGLALIKDTTSHVSTANNKTSVNATFQISYSDRAATLMQPFIVTDLGALSLTTMGVIAFIALLF